MDHEVPLRKRAERLSFPEAGTEERLRVVGRGF